MAGLDANSVVSRGLGRDPAVRAIARSWRELTGGRARGLDDRERRTLVACSGGADSSALAIALGEVTGAIVIGHVVHDLRPAADAEADGAAVRSLAARLGAGHVERRIAPASAAGNAEDNARRLRYEALENMAREEGCAFVATGHQASDELETVLMGLMRGAGPRGLGGVRPSRALSRQVTLIRPMLGLPRRECERLCKAFGWRWVEDETNADEARLRACVRRTLLPQIECVRPGASVRASRSAGLLREASEMIEEAAGELLRAGIRDDGGLRWEGKQLEGRRGLVLGELLRLAVVEVSGSEGLDRLGGVTIDAILEALTDRQAPIRRFTLRSVEVCVEAGGLRVSRK